MYRYFNSSKHGHSIERIDFDQQRRLVQLDSFDLNSKQHILLKSVLFAVVHAKVSAIEGAHRVGAADLLLEHRVLKAFE